MEQNAIVLEGLQKRYGEQLALADLSVQANEGEIIGLLGPNGAGKSTTIKIISGYLQPSSGSGQIYGFDLNEHSIDLKNLIGYLPEHNPLYTNLYVRESLAFTGRLYGLSGKKLKNRIDEVIEMVGLTSHARKMISELSKGYRQRVGLAQALIHGPKLLILDEPTTGLDPNQIIEIRNLIKEVARDKTVIFSSHILSEVQQICDRVWVLNQGQLVADQPIQELLSRYSHNQVKVLFERSPTNLNDHFAEAHQEGKYWIVKSEEDFRALIFDYAVNSGNRILEMTMQQSELEDVFKTLTNHSV
jgi:ABC-2 type transport system ATP-binding protein